MSRRNSHFSHKSNNRDNICTTTNMALCSVTIALLIFVFAMSGSLGLIFSNSLTGTNAGNLSLSQFSSPSYLYRNSLYVSELNTKSHDSLIKSSYPAVIIHYAPWCGHCRAFVSKFNEIAKNTNNLIAAKNRALPVDSVKFYRNVTFAAVNCVEQKSICSKVVVEFYPTIIPYNIKGPGVLPKKPAKNAAPGSDPERFNANTEKINKYLQVYFNDVNLVALGTGELVAGVGNSTSTNDVADQEATMAPTIPPLVLAESNLDNKAHYVKASDRLVDALTSFNYLLLTALPEEGLTKTKLQVLSRFTSLVNITLPDSANYIPLKTMYSSLYSQMMHSKLLEVPTNSVFSFFLRGKSEKNAENAIDKSIAGEIKSTLGEYNITFEQIRWQSCGVSLKAAHKRSSGGGGVNYNGGGRKGAKAGRRQNKRAKGGGGGRKRRTVRRDLLMTDETTDNRVLANTAEAPDKEGAEKATETLTTNGAIVNTTATTTTASTATTAETQATKPVVLSGNADSGTGYTCGLWMLFHYLTVSAEQHSDVIAATDVMTAIYEIMVEFFGCDMCRNHFIAHYNSCRYDRCDIKAGDYDTLQLWLYNLHNFVTYGVYEEKIQEQFTALATAAATATATSVSITDSTPVSSGISDSASVSSGNSSFSLTTSQNSNAYKSTVNVTALSALYDVPLEISKYLWPTVQHCEKCVNILDYSSNATTFYIYTRCSDTVLFPDGCTDPKDMKTSAPALTQKQIKQRKAELLSRNIQNGKILKYLKAAFSIE